MGKKKVKSINTTPLAAQTIGVVKKKRFNWIGGVILIAFFATVIFYMPEIQVMVDKYIFGKNPDQGMVINNNTTNKVPEKEPEEEEIPIEKDYLQVNENTTYKLDNLSFDDITYDSNEFSFQISTSSSINLSTKNYFVELFDNNKELIIRKYLFNNLQENDKQKVRIETKNIPTYYTILEIPTENFDYFILDYDENDVSKLVCSKSNQTLTYSFVSEILSTIEDVTNFNDFTEEMKTFYESKAETINNNLGFSAYVDSTEGKYIVNVEINKASSTNIVYYFNKMITPREVKFKMEALDYTCN